MNRKYIQGDEGFEEMDHVDGYGDDCTYRMYE